MEVSCSSKQVRKFLDLKQKLEVINEVILSRSPQEVATSFGISVSQVYKIHKAREVIANNQKDTSTQKISKILKRKGKHPEVDQAVFEWVCFIPNLRGSRGPLPVSRSMIHDRANYEAKLRNISTFNASDGWIWRWRWRFSIGKSVRLKGEAGGVNLDEAEKDMQLMRDAVLAGGYQVQNVFNMDETALLFRSIPNRTYVVQGGDKR